MVTKYIVILRNKKLKCFEIKNQLYDNKSQAESAIKDFKFENKEYKYYIRKVEL